MNHKFGIIIFVPIGTKKVDELAFDPEDPFCYNCGQKLINVPQEELLTNTCPGPQKGSANVKVYE
jgi:hypothetical protein